MIIGLLLAAGGSRRFGAQKLVAALDEIPLVRRAYDSLSHATDGAIVVVGSDADVVSRALDGSGASVVVNDDWARGLSTSIRCGVISLPPNAEAVLIALGDEPMIDPHVSRDVVKTWRKTGRAIVAARYDGVQDHPVLFDRSVFGELTALEGDVGAKSVINRAADRVAFVDVAAKPPIDVDEPSDLHRFANVPRKPGS